MLTLLCYVPADRSVPHARDLLDIIGERPGVELQPGAVADYWHGHWQDAATGAQVLIEIGDPLLEDDPVNPERSYEGWLPAPLRVLIPVHGPHWFCVEGLSWIQHLLESIPDLAVLDTDAIGDEDNPPTPGSLQRGPCLDSWEHQRHLLNQQRHPIYQMSRLSSVALWRYRKEQAAGHAAHADVLWPGTFVLSDGELARSACFWNDPQAPLALPPVELLVLSRGEQRGVLPSDELITVAQPGEADALSHGGAVAIRPTPMIADLYARAKLLPVERFRSLDDQDWCD